MFNIFINDISYFVSDSDLYNYADDNTLSCWATNVQTVVQTFKKDGTSLIKGCYDNQMKANPDKFQAIAISIKSKHNTINLYLDGNTSTCDENVKLKGVTWSGIPFFPPYILKNI